MEETAEFGGPTVQMEEAAIVPLKPEAPGPHAHANTPRTARQSVAARGWSPDVPESTGSTPPGPATQRTLPPVTERGSDGAFHPAESPTVVRNGTHDQDTLSLKVEHKCGHVVTVQVWRDEAKRKAQIGRIEKNALCFTCASGRK